MGSQSLQAIAGCNRRSSSHFVAAQVLERNWVWCFCCTRHLLKWKLGSRHHCKHSSPMCRNPQNGLGRQLYGRARFAAAKRADKVMKLERWASDMHARLLELMQEQLHVRSRLLKARRHRSSFNFFENNVERQAAVVLLMLYGAPVPQLKRGRGDVTCICGTDLCSCNTILIPFASEAVLVHPHKPDFYDCKQRT